MRFRSFSLSVLLVLSGCMFSNISTAEKFREMVDGVNEEARWSRLDLAAQRVHPTYRPTWAQKRSDWGDQVQIADSEVINLKIHDEDDTAESTVVVRWYRYDTMTLQTTTIEQSWDRVDGRFALSNEEIVRGDESLLAGRDEADADADGPDAG